MKRTNHRLLFVLLLLLLAFGVTSAVAQITPSQDSYTDTAKPTTNFGNTTTLGVSSTGTGLQTAYIQFDLSSIPSSYTSSNIAKATLKLYVNTVPTAGSFNVYLVNGSWAEKTITANLSPALGSTIASSVPLANSNVHDWVTIDVTTALGEWLNGSQANDGLALVANSGLAATLDSKENSTQSHPAELDIVYASGAGTITGVQTPSGSGLTGGGISGTLSLGLQTNCSSKQVLQWNGSAWVCASAGTGTITGVTAGTDLTGGGTGGTVTLNLDTTKVPLLKAANSFTANQTFNGNGNSAVIGDMGCGSGFAGLSLFGGGNGCFSYSILGDTAGNLYINRPTNGVIRFREGNADEVAIVAGGNLNATGNIGAASFTGDGSKLSNIATSAGTNFFTGVNWFEQNTTFQGNGEFGVMGDMGCANNSAGITFQGANCGNYALLDYYGQTILNRMAGQSMSFREGNGPDQMTIYSGGAIHMNTNGTPGLWIQNSSGASGTSVFEAVSTQFGGVCFMDMQANWVCYDNASPIQGSPVQGGGMATAVKLDDGRHLALSSVHSPEDWFEDYGSGTLSNGAGTVAFEPTFAKTVNTGVEYHVFVTPKGDCEGLYVSNETANGFEVHELKGGHSSLGFDYKIVAKRKGHETVRFTDKTEAYKQAITRAQESRESNKGPVTVSRKPENPTRRGATPPAPRHLAH